MNAYGFANGDPISFSDPFGLFGCTIKDISGCQIISFTAGASVGIGFKTQLGPLEAKGDLAKVGVEGSLSLTALGRVQADGEASGSAVSATVRLGSREAEATLGTCGTKSGCHAGALGVHGVEGASNGDVSVKAKFGIELGVTVHLGQIGTAIAGAANTAYTLVSGWLSEHTTAPFGTLSPDGGPPLLPRQ